MNSKYKDKIWTIPNILSMLRILLLPVYVYLYTVKKEFLASAIVLAVSMSTDAADGLIARRFNMISTFGKIIDPIADKLTQMTVLCCLSSRWWAQLRWVIVLFVIKEAFMLIAGLLNLKKGRMLSGALMAGKVCTTVLFVSMGLMVIMPHMHGTAVTVLSVLCCVAMAVSFAFYLSTYMGKDHGVEIVPLRKDEKG